jgi:hypothetical protein
MNLFTEGAGEFIGVVIGGFSFYVFNRLVEIAKENKKGRVSKAINKNAQIFESLVSLRTQLDCDRVKLFQFYNGDFYTTGQSTLKMHMTYCSVRPGVSYPQGFLYGPEGCPVTRISQSLKPLIDHQHLIVHTDDMHQSEWQSANTLNGTLTSLFVRIGSRSAIQGIIVCSYTKIDEIRTDSIMAANETAQIIAALISE